MLANLPSSDIIKKMTSPINFLDGMRYVSMGQVGPIRPAKDRDLDYTCTIRDRGHVFETAVALKPAVLTFACSCLQNNPDVLCAHSVALLLTMNNVDRMERLPSDEAVRGSRAIANSMESRQHHLTTELLNVFRKATHRDPSGINFSSGSNVLVEVGLTFLDHYSYQGLGISLKVGEKRVQYVPKISEFLTNIANGNPYVISKTLTYDPWRHVFPEEYTAFIRELQWIVQKRETEDATSDYYGIPYGSRHRYLVIPPLAFDRLLPYLRTLPVLLNHTDRLLVQDAGLPLQSALSSDGSHTYRLTVSGLSRLILLPAYSVALYDATLYPLEDSLLQPLYRMTRLAGTKDALVLPVSTENLEPILEHVIPALRKVSGVTVDPSITERVIDMPMKGLIYLDYQAGDVVAAVKVQYGAETLNALHPPLKSAASDTILIRDTNAEETLLSRLYGAGFINQEDRLYLRDEMAQFEFFMDHLPALQEDYSLYLSEQLDPLLKPVHFAPKTSVELTRDMNWLEVTFDMDDIDPNEVKGVVRSLLEKKRYHRLRGGTFLHLENPSFGELGTLLESLEVSPKELTSGTTMQLPALRGLNLIDQSERAETVALGRSLRHFLDNLKHPDNLDVPTPPSLEPTLRDYQRLGFQWMATLTQYGFGGILADDMGLGKTLQSIAFLLHERQKGPYLAPALIVCPASLMYNWGHEIARFAPSLSYRVVAGSRAERQAMMNDLTDIDILITSYPLLRRDSDLFSGHTYHALFIDEAQAIKNHATQTAQAVAALKSPRRFALTGTPIENSLDDLWSILHTVFPALFSNREAFRRMPPDVIARRVRPFLMRRLKRDVLKELPDKIETTESADLTQDQKKLYLGYLDELRASTSEELAASDFQKSRFKILAGLTRLRQICCHPGMFAENYQGGSGKLELLLEIIEQALASHKKMLIFSQFTSMLSIIKAELDQRHYPYFYLDGDTPVKDRLALTEEFNHGDRPIFLISLKAGGTGLNLTGADTVILYDLWWNPAVEEQAADRAHRIGQRNVVQVIRLITEGTIEEKMYELQQKKRDLVSQVIQATDEGLGALSEEDVRELLSL